MSKKAFETVIIICMDGSIFPPRKATVIFCLGNIFITNRTLKKAICKIRFNHRFPWGDKSRRAYPFYPSRFFLFLYHNDRDDGDCDKADGTCRYDDRNSLAVTLFIGGQ